MSQFNLLPQDLAKQMKTVALQVAQLQAELASIRESATGDIADSLEALRLGVARGGGRNDVGDASEGAEIKPACGPDGSLSTGGRFQGGVRSPESPGVGLFSASPSSLRRSSSYDENGKLGGEQPRSQRFNLSFFNLGNLFGQ